MALIMIIEISFLDAFFYVEFKNKPEISLSLMVYAVQGERSFFGTQYITGEINFKLKQRIF
jgi:hypothetical protein